MPYTESDVTAAIAKANGQKLSDIKVGGLNGASVEDLGPGRNIKSSGASPYVGGTGHVFAHVDTFTQRSNDPVMQAIGAAQSGKSRWQNRQAAISAATEMMNSPQAQPGIAQCASGNIPPSGTIWLKKIPLDGIYYGIEAGGNYIKQVETGSINFVVIGHSLFIYSCYPDGFITGNVELNKTYDLGSLFAV